MTITAAEAAREMLLRRAARNNIIDFANNVDVPGRAVDDDEESETFTPIETRLADHHRLLLNKAYETMHTPHGRLMVFMPPGSAKSTYASVVAPAHYMGEAKGRRVGVFTYGDTLAQKMGRRTRSIIKQRRYRGIFDGVELSKESASTVTFKLTNESEYMCGGILSAVTGNRLEGFIVDDPVKGREEANSETMRNKVWDEYSDSLLTRLVPGGWVIIIQTRWHEDDLAGRILPEGWNGESGKFMCKDGNEWEVLCLQAQCEDGKNDPLNREPGAYLWPEWFTAKHWDQFKLNARTWGALFQQRPSPLDGDLFHPDEIQTIDAIPAGTIRWVRGWDLASTENDGCWTAGVKIGLHTDGRVIFGCVKRKQYGPDKRDKLILTTTQEDGRNVTPDLPQDPGQAGKTQMVAFGKLLAGYKMKFSPESGDKVTRAEPLATQVNTGNCYMLRGDWNKPFKEELRSFPNGTWSDQVDAASRAYGRLIASPGKIKVNPNLVKKQLTRR